MLKRRWFETTVTGLVLVLLAGCATGRAVRNGDNAVKHGNWDAAVAYYRQALGRDPGRVDVKVALAHASALASADHLKRARDLEAQEQMGGAAAEYRTAADLDPTNSLAMAKALQIEQKIRDQIEASRPRPRIDVLREQAAQSSEIPKLDPRIRLPLVSYTNNRVYDILTAVGALAGITVTYDSGADLLAQGKAYTYSARDISLEDALGQILTANGLTYKIQSSKSIMVYQDNPQKRGQFEDVYEQTFYLSHSDANDLVQLINSLVGQGGTAGRFIGVNKPSNSIVAKATLPVLASIDQIIRANDKPRAEIMVDVEILEVDRTRIRKLGLDLSAYAVGFTLSPELSPANIAQSAPGTDNSPVFPGTPSPFNLGTVGKGIGRSDFYVTSPTALVHFLESDEKTKVLAKSQLRSREGAAATSLNLGDRIPTVTQQQQTNQFNGPTTSFQYLDVGVNVTVSNLKLTYQDEIIMDLQVQKSGLGQFFDIGGLSIPSFISRQATTSLRLRDGEANMLAGLIREEDRKSLRGAPGISQIPFLKLLLGNVDNKIDTSDIVMIVTPHIVRGHDLTPQDLKPIYIGTAQQFGASGPPPLIDVGAPPPAPIAPVGPLNAANPTTPVTGGGVTTPPVTAADLPPVTTPPPATTRAPGVVPVVPITAADAPSSAQIAVNIPAGEIRSGGTPITVPVMATALANANSVTLTINYNPAVLRATAVSQGTFMQQGGTTTPWAPKIDTATGRIDIVMARTGGTAAPGPNGVLAAIAFQPLAAGTSAVAISGVALTPDGKPIQIQMVPGTVVVK